jgi:hypothetical protein
MIEQRQHVARKLRHREHGRIRHALESAYG